jgi:uncharacterized protein (TIGR00645 family)
LSSPAAQSPEGVDHLPKGLDSRSMGKFLEGLFERGIFGSRWLLAPIYAGLIIAQLLFAVMFFETIWSKVVVPMYQEYVVSSHETPQHPPKSATTDGNTVHDDVASSHETPQHPPKSATTGGSQTPDKKPDPPVTKPHHSGFGHDQFIGVILVLLDMVMVANLLIIILIGGYATFVSKLDLIGHEDRPAWLDHIDPGTLKTKLAGSLVGVSGIHLLQSFINLGDTVDPENPVDPTKVWLKITIHMVFTVAVVLVAWSDLVVQKKLALESKTGHDEGDAPHKEH